MDESFFIDTHGNKPEANGIDIIYSPSKERNIVTDNIRVSSAKFGGRSRFFGRPSTSKRYHDNGRFHGVKPGHISFSDELREALDISRRDIPLHIYRMRSLGYPPGWLLKARSEQFPSFSDGSGFSPKHEVTFDEDAIIIYPGFNVYSSELREECHKLQCPSIQKCHLLENFVASLRNLSTKEEISQYKELLESKDLTDLENERQRLLSEINALNSSLSPKSSHIEFGRSKTGVGDLSETEQFFSSDIGNASILGAHKRETLESVGVNSNVTNELFTNQKSVATQLSQDEIAIDTEEGTAIPSNIVHIMTGTSSGSCSTVNSLGKWRARTKLPGLEAFSSGIQPYEPYANLPDSHCASKRVRDFLKLAKANPGVLFESEKNLNKQNILGSLKVEDQSYLSDFRQERLSDLSVHEEDCFISFTGHGSNREANYRSNGGQSSKRNPRHNELFDAENDVRGNVSSCKGSFPLRNSPQNEIHLSRDRSPYQRCQRCSHCNQYKSSCFSSSHSNAQR